jgi:hypothetical protein
MNIKKLVSWGNLLGMVGCLAGCENISSSLKFSGRSSAISPSSQSRSINFSDLNKKAPMNFSKALPLAKINGKVVNSQTLQPVSHAVVFHDGKVWKVDSNGGFAISRYNPNEPILIKASGFRQTSIAQLERPEVTARLAPFHATGLYLTHYGVSSKILREGVLSIIREGNLNALVLDVKGDRGYLSYKFPVSLAEEIGAHRIPTIKDIKILIEQLHEQNIYVIGRIVVFKDNLLSVAHPEWAVIDSRNGKPWKDNEELGWVDPFKKEVWDYNIALAKEVARAGFDEIQFDYVRFPTGGKISATQFSQANTMENRIKTIRTFLDAVNRELLPYNVYFSADIFGYVPWNYNDTDIGQSITELAPCLDYLCLMVYPSGFHLGIPGYRNPVENPYEVVYLTMEKAKKRLGGNPEKLRPWLQNFKDYAFDRRIFAESQIQSQITACEKADTSGWLLWDPTNRYAHTLSALNQLSRSSQMAQTGREEKKSGEISSRIMETYR